VEPRRAEPGQWLLKGLSNAGFAVVGTNCHKMRGRNGTWHRYYYYYYYYYYCRNHDPLRADGEDHRCPERNIRADALDTFVFDHIRAAITHPDQLLAGEQAVTPHTPIPDDELLSAELARLDRKIDAADTERRRLIDLYQGGFIELPEMQRRATEVSSRRKELQHNRTNLADERTTLARDNQLRRRVHDFAARIHAVIDTLDDIQQQQLLRYSSKTSGSPAGTSRSGSASPSTRHHLTGHTRPAQQAQQANRHPTRAQCQCLLKTVCVPLVTTNPE
jgi:site-specific DNA recombinase